MFLIPASYHERLAVDCSHGDIAAGSMTAALRQSLQETGWGFQFCLNTAHTALKAQEPSKSRGRLCNRIADEGENSS